MKYEKSSSPLVFVQDALRHEVEKKTERTVTVLYDELVSLLT